MAQRIDRQHLRHHWEAALAEDGFDRDVTSLVAVDPACTGSAQLIARQAGVFAGSVMLDLLREAYGTRLTVTTPISDADQLTPGMTIAQLTGPLRLLLGIERTLLNFLQRLCGIATVTRQYVDAVAGTRAKILDTRKTIPGWRQLDKYAVRCAGGQNHRIGLHDAVLIKDNHLAHLGLTELAAAAAEMIYQTNQLTPPPEFIEFEVDTLEQFEVLVEVPGIDVILLDNFSTAHMRKAVARRDELGLAGKLELEASGGVNLDTVRKIAETGVDRISIGALTHSVPALDIAMEIMPTG